MPATNNTDPSAATASLMRVLFALKEAAKARDRQGSGNLWPGMDGALQRDRSATRR